jgi:hypothetical protein
MKNLKKPYASPKLSQWGTVADVTGVGITRPGGDTKAGSVIPGGVGPAE